MTELLRPLCDRDDELNGRVNNGLMLIAIEYEDCKKDIALLTSPRSHVPMEGSL